MKIVIIRHQSDLQVFRGLAVAQAAQKAKPDGEVYFECFDRYKGLLELTPGIRWKNPHSPFEVSARAGEEGKPGRKGGKLYDEVISLEPDSPLELELINSGMPWWDFVKAKVAQQSELGASLKIEDFPILTLKGERPQAAKYALVSPLSHFAHPAHANPNDLEERAKKEFPGVQILWLTLENAFLGTNRPIARWQSYAELANLIARSEGVIAVNGIVSAIAKTIGKKLIHIPGKYGKAFVRDQFLAYSKLMEVEA